MEKQEVTGVRLADATGLLPAPPVEPVPVSPLRATIPSAGWCSHCGRTFAEVDYCRPIEAFNADTGAVAGLWPKTMASIRSMAYAGWIDGVGKMGFDDYGRPVGNDRHSAWRARNRDSDASLAEDPKGLSGEAVAARAEGIAQGDPA